MRRSSATLQTALLAATADYAAARFLSALRESKANFNPNQPRVPRGNPRGGEWTRVGGAPGVSPPRGRRSDRRDPPVELPTWEDVQVGYRAASREVQQFLERNRDPITRVLGGVQAAAGAGEALGGVATVAGGVATTEVGVGVAVAAAGAWMVTNGYDNFLTGWRALTTGSPQETNLHTALRRLGLSEEQATATEILLAGGASAGAARLTREALEQAAIAELNRRAIEAFARQPLNVRVGNRRIWDVPGIKERGEGWEVYDAQRTGFQLTPSSFVAIDQIHRESGTIVSNKIMDLALTSYSREGSNRVYNRLASYIDRVHVFSGRAGWISHNEIRERRLHVLFPSGEALPGQELQIAAAQQYAESLGVVMQIDYAN